jgi:antitoxin VapB
MRGVSMALNIKSDEVHALAAELARVRGVSLTQAVLDAVSHDLEREKQQRQKVRLAGQLLEIGKRCAARMGGKRAWSDHAAMLYDEKGLPR